MFLRCLQRSSGKLVLIVKLGHNDLRRFLNHLLRRLLRLEVMVDDYLALVLDRLNHCIHMWRARRIRAILVDIVARVGQRRRPLHSELRQVFPDSFLHVPELF